jgi:hypothetical protein
MKRQRLFELGILGLLVVTFPGCATLTGRWSGDDLAPAIARDQFDLCRPQANKASFVSAELRLQQDGTFTADIKYGSDLVRATGTWKLDGEKLSLTDATGRAQIFLVKRVDDNTLRIITGIKGTDVVLTMKKQV